MSELNSAVASERAADAPLRGTSLSRLNMILIVTLLVQVALIAYFYWPEGNGGASGAKLLDGVALGDVNTVTIADNTGNSISLERSGEGWAVAGTDGYPANGEKIETTLTKLLDVTADRLVTRTSDSHSRLQVAGENFSRRVTLGTGAGERIVYLGSSAGAGATHIRVDGQDETYLTGALASWELDTQTSGWIDSGYFNVPVGQIQRMTLTNGNGEFAFTRVDDSTWSMEGLAENEEVISANVTTIANRAAFVSLSRPLGKSEKPEYGMAEPSAVIELVTKDEEGTEHTYTLTVGAKDEESNTYYFKSSESPFYVAIAGFTGNEFSSKDRSNFARVPTPEPSDSSEEEGVPAEEATPEPEASEAESEEDVPGEDTAGEAEASEADEEVTPESAGEAEEEATPAASAPESPLATPVATPAATPTP